MHFIVNETAGHGTAANVWATLRAYLDGQGIAYTAQVTRHAGHATELTQSAVAQGEKTIYALGGDGTVREVVQGMVHTNASLGIIPAGTGNDIIKALAVPPDPMEALKWSMSAKARPVDVVQVNDRIGINVVGTGFDIETLLWTERFKKKLKGILPYLIGVVCSIFTHKDIDVALSMDGGEKQRLKALLITAANGVCIGGGMRVGPDARIDDGLLDVLVVTGCPKWKIPFLLPRFIKGRLDAIPYAKTTRCKSMVLEGKGQIIDLDGEMFPMDRAELTVLPGAILMIG